ncbi:MAG: transposase [Phycisphaerales bacterium]
MSAFAAVMESVRRPRGVGWPRKLAGDKGYSYPGVVCWLSDREIEAVIPQRSDQVRTRGRAPLDRRAYRRRSVIERCVGWLKENRHIGTRSGCSLPCLGRLPESRLTKRHTLGTRTHSVGSLPRAATSTADAGSKGSRRVKPIVQDGWGIESSRA